MKLRVLMPSHALCCLVTLAPRVWLPMIISWETSVLILCEAFIDFHCVYIEPKNLLIRLHEAVTLLEMVS